MNNKKMYNLEKNGKNNKNMNFKEVQMEASKLKNMVILKNLPSNIVEEAIVILKENKKVKKLEKIDKNKKTEYKRENKKDYVLKEAELVVSSYIEELEEKKKTKEKLNKKTSQKLKKLKIYSYITSIILFIETIILIAK